MLVSITIPRQQTGAVDQAVAGCRSVRLGGDDLGDVVRAGVGHAQRQGQRGQRGGGGEDPGRRESGPLDGELAEDRTDADAHVECQRRQAHGLATALRRREVGDGGDRADEEERLTRTGEQPQDRQNLGARRQHVAEHGGGEQGGSNEHERTPTPPVSEAASPGTQEEGRQAERADDQADGDVPGTQGSLHVSGHRREEDAAAGEVGERGQRHRHERRRQQGGPCRGRLPHRHGPDHRDLLLALFDVSLAARGRRAHR
jgi:hypothetical protein